MIIDLPRKSWKIVKPSPWQPIIDRGRVAAVAIRAGLVTIAGDLGQAIRTGVNRAAYAVADLLTPELRVYAC